MDRIARGLMQNALSLYLQKMREMGHSFEAYLLQHGKWFKGIPYDLELSQRTPKQCFKNAYYHTMKYGGIYCEGYAVHKDIMMPIQHAWASRNGNSYDPTWKDPQDCVYFGLMLRDSFVNHCISESGYWGVFPHIRNMPSPELALI